MTATTARLDAIEAQLGSISKGPWKASDFGYPGQEEPSSIIVHQGDFNWRAINDGAYVAAMPAWDSQEGANAEFIAAAPDTIRELLTLAREQAAALERVEAVVEHWEQTPALRRVPAAACIRAALVDGDE